MFSLRTLSNQILSVLLLFSLINACIVYEEYNLCSISEMESAIDDFKDVKTTSCRNQLEILSCGYHCFRHSGKYIRIDAFQKPVYQVCDNFCNSIWNACKNEIFSGIGEVRAFWENAHDFCVAQSTYDYNVEISTGNCFRGARDVNSAKASHSRVFGSGILGNIFVCLNNSQ